MEGRVGEKGKVTKGHCYEGQRTKGGGAPHPLHFQGGCPGGLDCPKNKSRFKEIPQKELGGKRQQVLTKLNPAKTRKEIWAFDKGGGGEHPKKKREEGQTGWKFPPGGTCGNLPKENSTKRCGEGRRKKKSERGPE